MKRNYNEVTTTIEITKQKKKKKQQKITHTHHDVKQAEVARRRSSVVAYEPQTHSFCEYVLKFRMRFALRSHIAESQRMCVFMC